MACECNWFPYWATGEYLLWQSANKRIDIQAYSWNSSYRKPLWSLYTAERLPRRRYHPSLDATYPGSVICYVVFLEMKVTDRAAGERVQYWSTQDPTCPLVRSLMAIPQDFNWAQQLAILFDGGLCGPSRGHWGACGTKGSWARRLPWEWGDVAGGGQGSQAVITAA